MSDHRVPMLGASLRRYRDPARSDDPRVRELVGALAGLGPASGPDPRFRAELRAQLVAVAPRLIAEGPADGRSSASPAGGARGRAAGARAGGGGRAGSGARAGGLVPALRGLRIGRPLAVIACTLAVFAALLGGAVWVGRSTLGSSPLSGVRSTAVRRAMSSSDTGRARLDLTSAASRYAAVAGMVPAVGPRGTGRLGAITSALAAANDDVRDAAARLGGQAVRNAVPAPLRLMTAFAPKHVELLDALGRQVGPGPVRTRIAAASALLRQADTRARLLMGQLGCAALTTSGTDRLGPLPVPACAASGPGTAAVAPSTVASGGAGSDAPSAPPAGGRHLPVAPPGAGSAMPARPARPGSTTPAASNGAGPLPSSPPVSSAAPATGPGPSVPACTPGVGAGALPVTACSLLGGAGH